MTAADSLRIAAEHLPPGASITVSREALLEALNGRRNASQAADFTVAQVAKQFGRSKSCIRSWLEQQLLRGYRLRGREWRVPPAAIREFEDAERNGRHRKRASRNRAAELGAWRKASSA